MRAQRTAAILGGAALCAALISTSVAPASAADDASPDLSSSTAAPEAMRLGGEVTAQLVERDGSLILSVPVGGVPITFSSTAVGADDRTGLGAGWGFGMTSVDVEAGVRIFPASGGVYEVDASQPSGLAGYGKRDLAFAAVPESVAARTDGSVPERQSAYRLRELGGVTTWFDDHGNPLTRTTPTGARTDWMWSEGPLHRPATIIDADGVVTSFDWSPTDGVIVRPGSNLPSLAHAPDHDWTVTAESGLLRVEDPTGGHIDVRLDHGLPTHIGTSSGATTSVTWRVHGDGVARVDGIRTVDEHDRELAARRWAPAGANLATGWPVVQLGEPELFAAAPDRFRFEVELAEGERTIRSGYTALRTMTERRVSIARDAGAEAVLSQSFSYPYGDELPDPGALPAGWWTPSTTRTTRHSRDGAERTTTEHAEYDDLGRPINTTAADGTTTTLVYDEVAPKQTTGFERAVDRTLPIGLTTATTVTAPDGHVTETFAQLNDARTAVIASETRVRRPAATADPDPSTVTARTEFSIDPDGFVSERREYPVGDASAAGTGSTVPPVVTTRSQSVDLGSGERTVTETVAAGSAAAATTMTTTSLLHDMPVSEIDAVGVETTTDYDALGRVSARIDASGTTRFLHETAQQHGRNAQTTVGADHVATTEERDPLGRVVRVSDNIRDGRATEGHVRVAETREYPDQATTIITDAWGDRSTVIRDGLGRVVSTETPTGLTEVTEFDDVALTERTGRTPTGDLADAELVTTVRTDPAGHERSTEDARADGRPARTSRTEVDGLGRATSVQEPATTTEVVHDAYGRPATTTLSPPADSSSGAAVSAERNFDGFGRSTTKTITDTRGSSASGGSREFDELGRVTFECDAAGRWTQYALTPDGLVASATTDAGQVTVNDYDDRTRRLVRTTTTSPFGANVTTATEHDPATGEAIAVFDPERRAETEIASTHDAFGNLLETRYPDEATVQHSYDEHGRKRSTTDTAGLTTWYRYGPMGLITEAVQRAGTSEGDAELARVTYTYDEFARVSGVDRGNGVRTEHEFTSAGEIARELTTDGEMVLADRKYVYDARGNLLARTDGVREFDRLELTSTTYRYDDRDRLVASSIHEGDVTGEVTQTTEYELGVTGDVVAETVIEQLDAAEQTRSQRRFEYSAVGELLAVTTDGERREQRYDAAGNLVVAVDGTEFGYDAANRVTSRTTPDVSVDLGYWADGSRRSQTATADAGRGESIYHWDGELLLNDHHRAAGGPTGSASYLLAAGRHSRTTVADGSAADTDGGAETTYYGADRHGNVTELIDANGSIVERSRYTDYGVESRETSGSPDGAAPITTVGDLMHNPFGFAGEQTDDGWQHLRDRVYDPGTAHFITEDVEPLMSTYGYADANPITNVDPTGHVASIDKSFAQAMIGVSAVSALITIIGIAIPPAAFTSVAFWGYAVSALAFAGHTYSIVTNAQLLASGALEEPDWFGPPADTAETASKRIGAAAATFVSVVVGFLGVALVRIAKAASSAAAAAPVADVAVTEQSVLSRFFSVNPVVSAVVSTAGAVAIGASSGYGTNAAAHRDHTEPPADSKPDWLEERLERNRAGARPTNSVVESLSIASDRTARPHPLAEAVPAVPAVAAPSYETIDAHTIRTEATIGRW
jgi:RHS repeat-associated protein